MSILVTEGRYLQGRLLFELDHDILNNVSDFSTEALTQYQTKAQIPFALDSLEFNRRLVMQGLLERQGQEWKPTGFGLLLFGKDPRLRIFNL